MSNSRFDGKVIVVTGATGGLGQAAAQRLAAEGANLVIIGRDGGNALRVANSLPTRSIGVAADVSKEEDVERYMNEAVETFGRVDHYVFNAGISGKFAPLPDVEVADFDHVMNVNVRGQFMGVRAAFRQFAAQGDNGNIAITASIASLSAAADLIAYHTSKHAVTGLVRGSAMYGGPLGIRVNAVAPGIVPTELFAAAAGTSGGKNDMERRASTTPLRRAGRAEEIAGVISFLLSEDSSYMTGQVVAADGGASISNTVRPSGGAGAWDTAAVDAFLYGDDPRIAAIYGN